MSRFLILFFVVYSFMHALFFFRVRVLLPDRWSLQFLSILFLIAMIAAPIGSYMAERSGHDAIARCIALVGFNWMGFIFIASCLCILMTSLDILALAANAVGRLGIPSLYSRAPALGLIGLSAILSVYGVFEARNVGIERITIETEKLPPGTERLKIAQISDLHLGLMARDGRLRTVIEKLRAEAPDLLIDTGDLVDGSVDRLYYLAPLFKEINPPYGKYAVTGNHEEYAGLAPSLDFLGRSGFIVLRGEAKTVGSIINIAGIDDPAVESSPNEAALLSSIQNGLFTLFLKHRPDVRSESLGLFDLQASGHTHRGQIFPFNYIVAAQYPYLDGYYEFPKGSKLYTSRGTGAWGPQMRLHSPPEITIFELVRKGG